MSLNVTLNGSVYIIPETGEVGWGGNTTSYLVAIAAGVLQKTGGSFLLSAEIDFGASFGLKSLYYKSRSSNIATTGILRLNNNSDAVSWRNVANSTDLPLTVDSSDRLSYNGSPVLTGTSPGAYVSSITGTTNQVNASASTGAVTLSLPQSINTSAAVQFSTLGLGSAIVASAILALTSTSLGFLPPRMSTAQRDLIASPATGLLIYNTTTNLYNSYNGSAWVALAASGGGTVNTGTQFQLGYYAANGTTISPLTTITTDANGNLRIPDGTVSLPGLAFSTSSSSGLFQTSAGSTNLGIVSNGVKIIGIASTGTPQVNVEQDYNGEIELVLSNQYTTSLTNVSSTLGFENKSTSGIGGVAFTKYANGFTGNYNSGLARSNSFTLHCGTDTIDRFVWDVTTATNEGIYFDEGTNHILAIRPGAIKGFSPLTITSTSNQIILGTTNTTTLSATAPAASRTYTFPDVLNNANVVLSEGTQTINGSKTFGSAIISPSNTITNTTNQLVLGTTNTTTISATAPSTSRTVTIPDLSADYSIVGTEGTQTINGSKTLSSALTITPISNQLVLGATRTITITAPTPATSSRTWTLPDLTTSPTFAALEGTQTFSGSKTFSSALTMSGANIVMGTNKVTGLAAATANGDAVRFEQLKIIQIVNASTSTEVTDTSGTYTDTGLTASITPTSSSNRVMVLVSQSYKSTIAATKTAAIGAIKALRGATNISENDRAFGNTVTVSGFGTSFGIFSFAFIDSPATTSATTYKTQFKLSGGGDGSVGVQPSGGVNAPSYIILMEVV